MKFCTTKAKIFIAYYCRLNRYIILNGNLIIFINARIKAKGEKEVKKEIIDKCLDFAEGNKGKFTILMVKKPNFPKSLIEGTEKQQVINNYASQGLTTRQIAEKTKCTQPNIVEHIRNYRRGVAFYSEWCEFWEFAATVRKTPVDVAFKNILSSDEIVLYKSKGVFNVGDFVMLTVTTSYKQLSSALGGLDADKKDEIFKKIKHMCYDVLTSEDIYI